MAVIAICRYVGRKYFCIALTSDEDIMAADLLESHLLFAMKDIDPEWKISRYSRYFTKPAKAVVFPKHQLSGWTESSSWQHREDVPSIELHMVLARINARAAQIRTFVGRELPVPDPKPWFLSLKIKSNPT